MKTKKKLWIIGTAAAAILLAAMVCAQWLMELQRPLCIKMLGDGGIRHVEASCFSNQGWQRETLDQDELRQLVRLMNSMQCEQITLPPRGMAYENRMIFSVEKTDGNRRHMVLAERTLTIDNDEAYLLSRRDARQIQRLFGEIL